MAESRAEQVAEALRAQLATIEGDGGNAYWYTPDRVIRTHVVDARVLDTSLDVIYVVSPEREEESPRTNGPNGIVRNTSFLTLTLLKRFTPDTENQLQRPETPDPSDPARATLQARMLRDVRKKLRSDVKLALGGADGVSTYVALPDTELGPEETYIEGWACVFARAVVTHHYVQDTP